MAREHQRICPLCEATCGLTVSVEGDKVTAVRGDQEDAFSEGYLCPKGVALKDLHEDPDRLRTPLIRENGTHREATWDEAFARISEVVPGIIERHGRDAVGAYLGNPSVHNTGLSLYGQALLRTLGSKNIFSASTVDQMPKQLACALLFGTGLTIPIPDLDRTSYLLILGANPLESNGSLMTAPNVGERLKRIQGRGGRIVVLDPKRTRTADLADEHHFIRPGTDALFLFAMVHTLFGEGLVNPGVVASYLEGQDEVRELAARFSPERVSDSCGISAEDIRRITREFAKADGAAIHARFGTCTQRFGTLASWLPEVLHALTGNLDRPGGAMFPLPAHGGGNAKGTPGQGKGLRMGRHTSRVSGRPEIFSEFPVACMAEEIDTPGEGQIKALFTVAGNPVLSTPNGGRLEKALEGLEFMVSLDIYLNETTRHADVILPGLSPLETCHYDMAFSTLAIQNHARYSAPVFPVPEGLQPEWQTVLRLVGILSGQGPDADIAAMDDMIFGQMMHRELSLDTSPIHDRDAAEILEHLEGRSGPERMLDFMLRTGPYGDGFGEHADGLSLAKLEANPHGVSFGPLKPRLPEVLRTPTGTIVLAQECFREDTKRLEASLDEAPNGMMLIGRRQLRSNNSWMHNVEMLVRGKERCTLQIHPDDAARLGLEADGEALVTSRTGAVSAPVELCDAMMPGVVSLPHGWGHGQDGTRMGVAAEHAGVNSNLVADETLMDIPSGNAVLCGIPVVVEPARVSVHA